MRTVSLAFLARPSSVICCLLVACSGGGQFQEIDRQQDSFSELAMEPASADHTHDDSHQISEANLETDNTRIELPASEGAATAMTFQLEPQSLRLKAGDPGIQFQAMLNGSEITQGVSFEILPGKFPQADYGSLSSDGFYEPALASDAPIELRIRAFLQDDPGVSDEASIYVEAGQAGPFLPCRVAGKQLPLKAQLYFLPPETLQLPDFELLQPDGLVCMNQLAVSPRPFDTGFPGVSQRFEWFGLAIYGQLYAPVSGDYRFAINSDDGSKLYVNQDILIDNDGEHGPRELEAVTYLEAGWHELRIDYFQGPRYTLALELKWQAPNSDQLVIIAPEYFRPSDLSEYEHAAMLRPASSL